MLDLLKNSTRIDSLIYQNQLINLVRLDLNHPQINGNKWLKLSQNITDQHSRYATFGGPHSNHLHAFSYACHQLNKKHVVFVRGIGPKQSPTLEDIHQNNALVIRLSRNDYAKKHDLDMQNKWKALYGDMHFIPEGGNNEQAIKACTLWLKHLNLPAHAQIAVSIGTGCTFQGFAKALKPTQRLIGLPAFFMDEHNQQTLLNTSSKGQLTIINAQKQERFAKISDLAWRKMKEFEQQYQIQLDPVYTGKTLFRLLESNTNGDLSTDKNCPIYFIHTGGIQGRRVYEKQFAPSI